ncbi:hypothetical protein [Nocardia gipuzkoensis]
MTATPRAAYIPFRAEVGWDAAVELAAGFLVRAGADANAIVIVPQKGTLSYSTVLKQYAQNRPVLTPRNSNQIGIGRDHPALVYAPALQELELAMRYVRDHPIAVVEDPSFSCSRWADEIGAINLIDQKTHSIQRSPEHQRILERIDWAGNNGWGDAPGKRDLRQCLDELAQLGEIDKEEVLAYQLVHGRHGFYESLRRLGEEIDRAQRR